MKCKTGKLVILLVVSITTLFLVSCKTDSADNRLLQLETIVDKWENELRSRPADFEDLVYIQTDITVYDVDKAAFESTYGTLTVQQQIRLTHIKNRFRKLLKESN